MQSSSPLARALSRRSIRTPGLPLAEQATPAKDEAVPHCACTSVAGYSDAQSLRHGAKRGVGWSGTEVHAQSILGMLRGSCVFLHCGRLRFLKRGFLPLQDTWLSLPPLTAISRPGGTPHLGRRVRVPPKRHSICTLQRAAREAAQCGQPVYSREIDRQRVLDSEFDPGRILVLPRVRRAAAHSSFVTELCGQRASFRCSRSAADGLARMLIRDALPHVWKPPTEMVRERRSSASSKRAQRDSCAPRWSRKHTVTCHDSKQSHI